MSRESPRLFRRALLAGPGLGVAAVGAVAAMKISFSARSDRRRLQAVFS